MRIDGCGPLVACYRLAGECGVSPAGLTLRQLWWMAGGRRQAVRQQAIWQSAVILGGDKLDAMEFLRRGSLGKPIGSRVTMSPELRRKVEAEIGRLNRSA